MKKSPLMKKSSQKGGRNERLRDRINTNKKQIQRRE
jgi:hypothetical protein